MYPKTIETEHPLTPPIPIRRFEMWLIPLLAALYAIVRWIILNDIEPLHYNDSVGYIEQYKAGFAEGFLDRPRPWAYPLFIFLMDHDLDRVIVVQRLIAIASWIILSFSMWRFFSARSAAIFSFASMLFLSLTLNIIQWDVSILTESLSVSLLALITAALIIYLSTRSSTAERLTALILLVPISLIFAALRDVNAFLLPVIFVIVLIHSTHHLIRSPPPHHRPPIVRIIVIICVIAPLLIGFVFQLQSIDASKRSWVNTVNVISIRALIKHDGTGHTLDRENLQWFRQHYRIPNEVVRRAGQHASVPPPISDDYVQWIKDSGIGAWKKFLLTHPGWAWKTYTQFPSLFGYSGAIYMFYERGKDYWAGAWLTIPINLHQWIYRLFGWFLGGDWLHEFLLLTLALFWSLWSVSIFVRKPWKWSSTIVILVFFSTAIVLNISIALFGDAIEDWRHALMGLIALHIGAIFALSSMLDAYATPVWHRRSSKIRSDRPPPKHKSHRKKKLRSRSK